MSAAHTLQSADGILELCPPHGITKAAGLTVPTDATAGFAPGCQFTDLNAAAGAQLFLNEGTVDSCLFKAVGTSGTAGAGSVGILDTGGFTSQTTVEGAIAELYQNLFSSTGNTINMPIANFRITSADGLVGNTAQGGGSLSNETAPSLGNTANGTHHALWGTGAVAPIMLTVSVPPDMDTTANATLKLIAAGGATNAPSFTAVTIFNNQAPSAGTVVAGTAATGFQNLTSPVTAANMTANGTVLTIKLTPGTHASDAFQLAAVQLMYKRKLLTS